MYLGSTLLKYAIVSIPSILALPALPVVVTVVGGGLSAGLFIANKITGPKENDVWFKRTERHTYKAKSGHVIYADPSY
jgi:hypothetical protein